MTKPFTLILVAALLAECQNAEKHAQNPVHGTGKNNHHTSFLHSDSNFFDKPVAIVVSPSERLIAAEQKELDSTTYDTVVDDNVWYQSEAERYLDSVKALQVRRQSEGILSFKTNAGKVYTMRIDTLFFGVILFNGKNKPISADVTDMGSEYSRYMK